MNISPSSSRNLYDIISCFIALNESFDKPFGKLEDDVSDETVADGDVADTFEYITALDIADEVDFRVLL